MMLDCVGEIQSSLHGFRVSLKMGGKEYYGPYRNSIDTAKADLAKMPCEEEMSFRSLKLVVRLRQDVGSIQSSRYGYRVRFKKDRKDYYGPYRRRKESAWEDLARLNSKKGDFATKNILEAMKGEVGIRRGGRKSASVAEGFSPVEDGGAM